MPKFNVTTVQLITQTVIFEVEAEDETAARVLVGEMNPAAAIVDSQDEEYLQNIVVEVEEVK